MTSCFVARISNPGERFGKPFYSGERFGKPFYEVDVPSPLSAQELDLLHQSLIAEAGAAIGVGEETW